MAGMSMGRSVPVSRPLQRRFSPLMWMSWSYVREKAPRLMNANRAMVPSGAGTRRSTTPLSKVRRVSESTVSVRQIS